MAVASSGQLRFLSVAKELRYNNPAATIPDSIVLENFPNGISLTEMSTGAGAFSAYPINQYSLTRPDGNTPHAISEFYGYDHDASNSLPPSGIYNLTNPIFIADEGWSEEGYTGNPDTLARTGYDWRLKTFTLNYSSSIQVRLIIKYYHDAYNELAEFFVNSIRIGSSDANHYYPEREGSGGNYITQKSTTTNSPPSTWDNIEENNYVFSGGAFVKTKPIWGWVTDSASDRYLIWNPLLEIYQGSASDTELDPYPPAYAPNDTFNCTGYTAYDSHNWLRTPAVTLPSGTNELSFIYATNVWSSTVDIDEYRYSYFQVFLEVI